MHKYSSPVPPQYTTAAPTAYEQKTVDKQSNLQLNIKDIIRLPTFHLCRCVV